MEIGVFYKIIEQLKLSSPEEEQRYSSVYDFIMQNSKDVQDVRLNSMVVKTPEGGPSRQQA